MPRLFRLALDPHCVITTTHKAGLAMAGDASRQGCDARDIWSLTCSSERRKGIVQWLYQSDIVPRQRSASAEVITLCARWSWRTARSATHPFQPMSFAPIVVTTRGARWLRTKSSLGPPGITSVGWLRKPQCFQPRFCTGMPEIRLINSLLRGQGES